jgi:hypothetical protein
MAPSGSTMSRSEKPLLGGELELRIEDLAIDPGLATDLPGFGAPCESWLDTGRSALAVAARDILRRGGRPVAWIPAYGCDAVGAPFRDQGFAIRHYSVGLGLQSIDAEPATGDTFLFIHYFGHRNRAAIARVPAWRADAVHVVEDCAQAGLSEGVGTHGDYAVSSLRKLLPLPDGALLASQLPLSFEAAESDEEFIDAKVAGKLLRGARAPADTYLRLFEHAESRLRPAHPRRMSWLAMQLLRGMDLGRVRERRCRNWRFLFDALRSTPALEGVEPLLPSLDDGDVPLGLPVRVPRGQRDALRRHLAGHEIYCPIHWPLEHVPAHEFVAERSLSTSVLTLPLDQRYDVAQLARIVDALQSFPGDLR